MNSKYGGNLGNQAMGQPPAPVKLNNQWKLCWYYISEGTQDKEYPTYRRWGGVCQGGGKAKQLDVAKTKESKQRKSCDMAPHPIRARVH